MTSTRIGLTDQALRVYPLSPLQREGDTYVGRFDVPGISKFKVTVNDNTLRIEGAGNNREFVRSLTIPNEIDPTTGRAEVELGVLTVTFDIRPESRGLEIPVVMRGV